VKIESLCRNRGPRAKRVRSQREGGKAHLIVGIAQRWQHLSSSEIILTGRTPVLWFIRHAVQLRVSANGDNERMMGQEISRKGRDELT
jgi:hypothetical protein